MDRNWNSWFDARREQVEQALAKHLKREKSPHSPVAEAVWYSVSAGGKRLRPILVLEVCAVLGGAEEDALPAAVALECVHTFSLIHDDLPAMDDDDLRRGNPTCHVKFGQANAILAGDWLLNYAYGLLAAYSDTGLVRSLTGTLTAGTSAMIIGQAADIEGESRGAEVELVRFIHEHKTAALFETACRMGALCGSSPAKDVERMGRFGRSLGLCFQIADDLLDATGDTALLGKRANKDADASKQTYPAVYGINASSERARECLAEATAELRPFGEAARHLCALAEYALKRDR
ncbi:MAG: polyprenyl synthetase family protein [Planctomycetes bacterium]|nr:polyprenyl synthetase family protein [Planctomycetota bacterium]